MPKPLPSELAELQQRVEEVARGYGLDFFTSAYEMLDYDEINMVASYMGFPVRYPHWKWGMEYERLSKSFEYGMNKIYEMVINNDPCYAYLQESNSYTDQKLVMCHVTGHNDFFKNNFAFSHTNRKMIDKMANHATRVRRYIDWFGVEDVEGFIDRVLSLDNLIDCHAPYMAKSKATIEQVSEKPQGSLFDDIHRLPTDKEYMRRYINPDDYIEAQKKALREKAKEPEKFPKEPQKDVLAFLQEHAPLKRWQRDIIDMLREEAYYFLPQGMTKIMNEGWASYWHSKLMTESMMDASEVIDFADRHSGVVATNGHQLNPYKLGIELFRDIEDRWNKGRFGLEWEACENMAEKASWDKQTGLGQKKIFEVRKIYSDITFLDEFFTVDFCKRAGFFAYGYDKKRREYIVETREFEDIKKKLLNQLTNMGQPCIKLVDANFENKAELLLEHTHDGVDLDVRYAHETMKNLQAIWSRPVNIWTKVEDREVVLSFDGEKFKEKQMKG